MVFLSEILLILFYKREKRIVQPEILIPKELTIIDQSDLGKSDNSDHQVQVESISTFFQSRIDELHIQLQKEIARAQYSRLVIFRGLNT